MADAPLPTVRSRRLGMMLRRLREERGLSTHAAARLLNRSQASVSKLETGHRGIHRPSLENLLDRYGVTDDELRETLFRLARGARTPGWWQSYDGTLSPEAMDLIGLEAEAAFIGFFEIVLIPGLFQTEAYARSLIGEGPFADDRPLADRLVDVRLKRQRVLTRPDPPRVHAIIDEAALHRQVGGRDVMRAQLERLIEVSAQAHVALQVLPFSAGAYQGMSGAFMLLDVGRHGDLRVAAVDSLTEMSYRETSHELEGYYRAFDGLERRALSEAATRLLIERLLVRGGRAAAVASRAARASNLRPVTGSFSYGTPRTPRVACWPSARGPGGCSPPTCGAAATTAHAPSPRDNRPAVPAPTLVGAVWPVGRSPPWPPLSSLGSCVPSPPPPRAPPPYRPKPAPPR